MGCITCCGTGAAIELDAGPDGDSIAAILLSSRSIIVTTKDISELVTWEAGPDTSVAGEGVRPIVVDGRGVVVDIGGDSIGTLSGGVNLPGLVGLSVLGSFSTLSSSVPESLSCMNAFPGISI